MVVIILQLRKYIVSYDILLDNNVYHSRDIEIFGFYVSVNYQLNSLTVQLIDGRNPLLTKVIL